MESRCQPVRGAASSWASPQARKPGSPFCGTSPGRAGSGATGLAINVGRADLDGSNVDDSFITGGSGPCGFAVDSQFVYWANNASGTIGRANLDGTGVDQTFIPNAGAFACGVAVDDAHIYWTNAFVGTTLGRADLDGSNVDPNFITGLPAPGGVAVDDRFIYRAGSAGGAIGRADLDGTNVDTGFVQTSSSPLGVTVAPVIAPIPAVSPLGLGLLAVALFAVALLALAHRRRGKASDAS